MLRGIVLEGRLVTGDAMFCQRDLSQQIIDAHGHYLWFVKDNQPTLRNDIKIRIRRTGQRLFPLNSNESGNNRRSIATTVMSASYRRERRTLKATIALNEYLDWPGVAQVGQIESVVEQGGKVSHETRYFITSVPRDIGSASQLLVWGRGHWSIENRSYHARDATLWEDEPNLQRIGPENHGCFA